MTDCLNRLEQMLRFWETVCITLNCRERYQAGLQRRPISLFGPAGHYSEFRTHLLTASKPDSCFDHKRFNPGGTPLDKDFGASGDIPHYLWLWCRNSRKIFHLEHDLQALLSQTSLEGVLWKEIPWPFESFVLKLEKPVVCTKGHSFDYLMFCSERRLFEKQVVRMAYLRLIDTKLASFQPINTTEHQKMLTFIKKGRYKKAANLGRRWQALTEEIFYRTYLVPLELVSEVPITSPANEAVNDLYNLSYREGEHPEWDLMVRLAAGFSLYLASLPPGSSHRSDWTPLSKSQRLDARAITNEAQVCQVTSVYKLSDEERFVVSEHEKSKKPTYEMCAHFRRGHWRRPPGKGNDPAASRSVWVRPTFVRQDRLAQGALPCGGEIIVS